MGSVYLLDIEFHWIFNWPKLNHIFTISLLPLKLFYNYFSFVFDFIGRIILERLWIVTHQVFWNRFNYLLEYAQFNCFVDFVRTKDVIPIRRPFLVARRISFSPYVKFIEEFGNFLSYSLCITFPDWVLVSCHFVIYYLFHF